MLQASDEELMEHYRDGDATAFDALYARHKGGTYRYVLRQCGNESIAAELHQDIWLKLIQSRERYTVQAKFTTLLYRIAHNRVIDHYRSEGVRRFESDPDTSVDEVPAAGDADPAHRADLAEQTRRVTEILDALPAEQRETFVMRHESGMSLAEIAEVTGVGRETVKSRLRYALNRLREALGNIA